MRLAHRHLMQLYSWNGQRSEALRQYQECVRILEQELGVPPMEETTRLYEHIRTQKELLTSEGDQSSPAHDDCYVDNSSA